jgi:hypothetical protein
VIEREAKAAVADAKDLEKHHRKRRRVGSEEEEEDEEEEEKKEEKKEEQAEEEEDEEEEAERAMDEAEAEEVRYLSHEKRQQIKQRGMKASLKVFIIN